MIVSRDYIRRSLNATESTFRDIVKSGNFHIRMSKIGYKVNNILKRGSMYDVISTYIQ